MKGIFTNMEENFEMSNVSATMTEEALLQQERKEEMRKKLRFFSNRIGWATTLFIALWMFFLSAAGFVLEATESLFQAGKISFSGADFYNRYILILNSVTQAVAMAISFVILFSLPKKNEKQTPIAFSRFVIILLICFGAGYAGNLIGTVLLGFWNAFTGNSVGGELQEVLYGINPLIMFVSVVILAPLLEELFFRKLLIDRLRPFGKIVSVFLPAFLFALFHQSATQLIYAFTIGAVLAYLYYETGNYWLSVSVHALFNFVSGFIPMLFLPKMEGFMNAITVLESTLSEVATLHEIIEKVLPLLENYGFMLVSYLIYALLLFAINITGMILLFINLKQIRKMKEESLLGFGESVKAVMFNPGMIGCTAFLGVLTLLSLFTA